MTEIEMLDYEVEIKNLLKEKAEILGLHLNESSNRGITKYEIRHPLMKYSLFETISFPEAVGFLAGYGLRPEADKYNNETIFSQSELRGFEKTYNWISEVKLKRLSEGLIGIMDRDSGKIDWLKVNTQTRKEIKKKNET